MALKIDCPECQAKLSLPESTAGKRVKCPKCQAAVAVPEEEPDFEVVEDEEEETPKQPKAKKGKTVEEDDDEEQPRKKKSKKKGKAKKQSASPAKLIGTVLALFLALGAIAFAVIRHTSRGTDTAKPAQNNDSTPTPVPVPNPNPPKTGANPTTPKTQPPIPKPEPTPEWEVWNPPKSGFGMRIPPAANIEYQDQNAQTEAIALLAGPGRVTGRLVSKYRVASRGFQAEMHVLFLKPGLSHRDREEVMLAQAKFVRELKSLFKVGSESEVTWAGQKARNETFEGEGEAGFRRFCHTETAVYYLEAQGFAHLAKHWMKDLTTSVDSVQLSPIVPTFTPTQSANPFVTGSISWLALPHSGTQLAAFGIVPVDPKDRNKGDKSQVQLWDRTKPTTESPARQLISPNLGIFTGPMAFSHDDKLLVVVSHESVIFFNTATGQVQSTGSLPKENRTVPASIAFTPDNKAAVVIANDSIVTIQAADGNSSVRKPKGESVDRTAVYLPAVNKLMVVRRAANFGESEIASWNPTSDDAPTVVPLVGIKGFITAFSVSPDGKRVAVCPNEGETPQVTIHDTVTGKVTTQMPVDRAANYRGYSELLFSPDGQFLAGLGRGDVVRAPYASLDLFRVSNGQLLYHNGTTTAPRDAAFVKCLTFTPDSKSLYFVQESNKVVNISTEPSVAK
jgi:hypothetical protein